MNISNILKKLRPETSRSSLALIVVAAVLVEVTSAVQYWFAREGIREEVQQRAETELKVKSLEIQKVMVAVEAVVQNSVWEVEQQIDQPDSLYKVIGRIVSRNKDIVGVGVSFVADYYPERGRWFEPYVAQRADGSLEKSQIGGTAHDYLNMEWFHQAMASSRGYWSEPYYDNAGAKMMLCSYFAQLRDKHGRVVALLGADVSLDWLSEVINANPIYPSSFNVMISRTGRLMVCPVESLVMRHTIQEVTSRVEDTTANLINQQMMDGKSGHASMIDEKGEKNYVFYAPVEGKTGWSMAVVCNDREIYRSLRQIGFNLMLLFVVGLALMAYIVWRTIRSMKRLEATRNQKASMESELRIASGIQKALLPKKFPPYPERTEVDIHAVLKPARQIGGDLYDFYIRDEKLYFCVGDVSGKGVPASLVMAITRTLFRNVSARESCPNRILSAMNDTMADENDTNLFVTFFVGVLDLPTGRLRYSNAGHEAPVVMPYSSPLFECAPLSCDSNLPLGVMKGWMYTLQEVKLEPNTTLFMFTDGLTEAADNDDCLFGKERMMKELSIRQPEGQEDVRHLVDRVLTAVHCFVNGAVQSDDLTMLAVHYTMQPHQTRLSRAITLSNDLQTVPQLTAFVEEACQAVGCTDKQINQINLAVEEAVVNVMNYAYPAGEHGDVTIEAQADEHTVRFVITDDGVPFDPTASNDVDVTLSAEDRPIGGLGIHLVRKMMDSINYNRVDGKNILTLIKTIHVDNKEKGKEKITKI